MVRNPHLQRICFALAVITVCGLAGCRAFNAVPLANPRGQPTVGNPLYVPLVDRWVVMNEVADVIDDYFRIYREERIRVVDGIMTEGWIETHPKIGATALEPWLKDSTPGFERLHATLQTVRRFAKVRVIPTGNNYQVDVKVYKELEELSEPKQSTVSGRVYRHDNSLDLDGDDSLLAPAVDATNKGWIPMGRDLSLEQEILRNVETRLQGVVQSGAPPPLENCADDPASAPRRIPRLFQHNRR